MPQNPNNSTIIQAILDIIAVADPIKHKELLATLNKVSSVLIRDKRLQHAADQKFHSHLYPEKTLTFAKTQRYDGCPERFRLSIDAQAVLGLLERVASQEGLVRIPQGVIAAHFGLGRGTVRSALDELVNEEFIAVYEKPPRGSKTPITYLIDKRITCAGKDATPADIEQFITLKTGCRNLSAEYQQAILSVKSDDDRLVKIGTLIKKEPSQPDSTQTDSGDSPHNSQTEYTMKKSSTSISEGILGQMSIFNYEDIDAVFEEATSEKSPDII